MATTPPTRHELNCFIFFVHTVGVLLQLAYSLLSLHSNAMYQLPFRVPKPEVPTKYKDI